MGSRERRRADRRKRKERSSERRAELAAQREARAARTEAKNESAREELEPLAEGERPTVVTVGAVLAAILAVSIVVAYIAGAEVEQFDDFGNETGEAKPNVMAAIVPAGVMALMAYGLWRAKYWAVLGFQTILVLVIVVTTLGLVQATELTQVLGNLGLLAVACALFYRMVKAMARIQMPERPDAR
jgi:hypothetical protein